MAEQDPNQWDVIRAAEQRQDTIRAIGAFLANPHPGIAIDLLESGAFVEAAAGPVRASPYQIHITTKMSVISILKGKELNVFVEVTDSHNPAGDFTEHYVTGTSDEQQLEPQNTANDLAVRQNLRLLQPNASSETVLQNFLAVRRLEG